MGINEETKPKSIIIDGKLHSQFKMLCKGKSMKIGGIIEDLIKLYLRDPKETQRKIDELKEEESAKSLRTQMFEAIAKK
jgi:ERCC4-type nuclease